MARVLLCRVVSCRAQEPDDCLLSLPRLAQGNLEALERVWQLTDERGWTVDWRETLANEGRHIAFA